MSRRPLLAALALTVVLGAAACGPSDGRPAARGRFCAVVAALDDRPPDAARLDELVRTAPGDVADDVRALRQPSAAEVRDVAAPVCGEPAVAAALPPGPLGEQLGWVLDRLAGEAPPATAADVEARFAPEFLTHLMPAPAVVDALSSTASELGPLALTGYLRPPDDRTALALVGSPTGFSGAVHVEVGTDGRITALEVTEAPAEVVTEGPAAGWFDVGGRRVFLSCTGEPAADVPTVVLTGGLSHDWVEVQRELATVTRTCSWDRPNVPFGRSDRAPTPRRASDLADDLTAALDAAGIDGELALVGHSNGGLVAQLLAARHPQRLAGLVLLDAVHPQYRDRRIELIRSLLPPEQVEAAVASALQAPPPIVDPEQLDVAASSAEVGAALAAHPLPPVPLVVVRHGVAAPSGGPAGFDEADEALWVQLQEELAGLVPGGEVVVAEGASHDLVADAPAVVVDAVRQVVAGS